MVIANFTGIDINDIIETILPYKGKCIVSNQQIIASDNIADSLLKELRALNIIPIAIAKCSSNNILPNSSSEAQKLFLDYVQGHFLDDMIEMRSSLQTLYEMKSSAYCKATNTKYGFPISKKILSYLKFYQYENSDLDFDENLLDFDNLEQNYSTATNSKANTVTYHHKVDEHHFTEIPSFEPYRNLTYPNPKFGQVYWVDFGEPYGGEVPYVRPAVVIQASSLNQETVLVVPSTSQIDRSINLITNPMIKVSSQTIFAFSHTAKNVVQRSSQLLFSKMRVVDKRRLRRYLYTFHSNFLIPIVKNAISSLVFSTELSANLANSFNSNSPEKATITSNSIQIDVKNLSDMQRQILNITKQSAYFKLKSTHLPEKLKIKEFLIEAYDFKRDSGSIELLIDCISYTIHETKNFYFNLNEYALKTQTSKSNYDFIVKSVTNIVRERFYMYPKLKISEFISLVAKIIGGK